METEKYNNNSDNYLNKNTKIESPINLSYNAPEKFDFITKSKELNSLKEEILSYFRERDSYLIEKIKNLQFKSDINSKKIEELSETLENNNNTFLSKHVELATKVEKLKSYDAFMNKANDKLISQEIRLNNLREDLTKNSIKYDQIFLENLIVPGYIGKGAKYSNCKIFFSEVIKELDKLNTFKEKNILDLSSYKDRLEGIIKTFQLIVDNYNNSQIKYITKLNEQTNKNILEVLEEKLKNLRMENSHFSIDLIKKTNELNSLYDNVKYIQRNIIKEFRNIIKEYNNKIEEANKYFDEYKAEQNEINKKFINYFSLIKLGKFPKNFGFQLGFRQNKELKSIKYNYERNNNTNIDIKNFFEIKQNNVINRRLSKSQNNFNSGNNIINLHKNININSNQRKIELKKHRNSIDSLLNYSRTSSVKSFQKNNNILKYNLNIKEQKGTKGEIHLINTSKSQRNDQTTLNLLNNFKTEKDKIPSYEEITDLKTNAKDDELSLSGSALSNMNNSVNTYSTTNENNNTMNNINVKTKTEGFGLIEKEKEKDAFADHIDNDKIIKEIASELEQSTAKGNILCSNKKEIEKNFKSICDKIQPINLKLNNPKLLEKIVESDDKNFSNKSEQNSTLFSNKNLNSVNINTFNINENYNTTTINDGLKQSKLKELFDNKDTKGENINLDQRMNIYDTKLINLESFTKDKFFELVKQINHLKKNYTLLTNYLKKENKNKSLNSVRITGYKTINNINNSFVEKRGNNLDNNSVTNNENKNMLNLTSNYFNKKPATIEIASKLSSLSKNIASNDDINLSQSLFHNGKYFANIKDIFGQKKFENKKLLKPKNINKEKENIPLNNDNNSSNRKSLMDKKEYKYIDKKQFKTDNNKNQ